MRLDKLISNSTAFSRSQAKINIKKGKVTVEGEVVNNPAQHVNEDTHVEYMGVPIKKPELRYIMFNKPAGMVCANKDREHATVFDNLFLPRIETLHVAGRLDIDTTGLVLITDDGEWSHRLTSPKHQHEKTYLVGLEREITKKQIENLIKGGIMLNNEKKPTLPAKVEKVSDKLIRLSIIEGKYHQVKRMLAAVGNHVVKLHREKIGNIQLDTALKEGEWRLLSEDEIKID